MLIINTKHLKIFTIIKTGDNIVLNVVKGIESLISTDGYNIFSIGNIKIDFPIQVDKLEETLFNWESVNVAKILKTEIPDKRNDLSEKLAYLLEYFNSNDDYQKPVNTQRKTLLQ